MRIPYEDDLPLVSIRVVSSSGEKEFKAHLDFAASKTLVPSSVADELNLPFEAYLGEYIRTKQEEIDNLLDSRKRLREVLGV